MELDPHVGRLTGPHRAKGIARGGGPAPKFTRAGKLPDLGDGASPDGSALHFAIISVLDRRRILID
jgi:hypothetical protein